MTDKDYISLDIDIPYSEWVGGPDDYEFTRRWTVVRDFLNSIDHFPILEIRRSAQGRVHYRIRNLCRPLLPMDEYQIRAYLGDDPCRIAGDLCRSFTDQNTGRLFDEKYIRGRVYRAGKWKEVKP